MFANEDAHGTLKPGTHMEVLTKKQLDGKGYVARFSARRQTCLVLMSWSTIPVLIMGLTPKTNYKSSLNQLAGIQPLGRSS